MHFIVHGLFLTAGLIAFLASVLNWNWFFNARNARVISHYVGRNRTRLLYGILGLVLMAAAVFFYYETVAQYSAVK